MTNVPSAIVTGAGRGLGWAIAELYGNIKTEED
jgi:NAD(P)-dependent dehydrogenase (short-subunit alcohol dehydrogenase family)